MVRISVVIVMAVVIAILPVYNIQAQETEKKVHFFAGDWQELQLAAKSKKKPFFVDFYATWCGPCKLLDKTTFRDSAVSDYANSVFIPFKADVDQRESKDIAQVYNVTSMPTIIFFDADGNVLGKKLGYTPPDEFLKLLQKYSPKGVAKSFKSKPKLTDFIAEKNAQMTKMGTCI